MLTLRPFIKIYIKKSHPNSPASDPPFKSSEGCYSHVPYLNNFRFLWPRSNQRLKWNRQSSTAIYKLTSCSSLQPGNMSQHNRCSPHAALHMLTSHITNEDSPFQQTGASSAFPESSCTLFHQNLRMTLPRCHSYCLNQRTVPDHWYLMNSAALNNWS